MLKKIEINGFKSFAKKTTLEFSSPISGVVGPNGSGKSNVAEAFRWVLGEQSLKSLRGKRGEDLIFNGSHESPRLNHASVALAFDNRQKKFHLEYEEVTIARHVYRDGANEYEVNGSKVRLKDVIELLASVGIGDSGHHIISQGEADRMLAASSRERREMIEDALGLRVYEHKREESEKKLAKTEANVREMELVRREIGPHLKFLKKQVERFEAADAMREELRDLFREYLARETLALERDARTLAEEQAPLARTLAEIEAGLAKGGGDEEVRACERTLARLAQEKEECARKIGRLEGALASSPAFRELARARVCPSCGQEIREETSRALSVRAEELEATRATHAALEARLAQISEEEGAARTKLQSLREADRARLETLARRSETAARLESFRMREERIRHAQEDVARERGDVRALVGDVLSYTGALPEEDPLVQRERQKKIQKLKVRLEDAGAENPEILREYNQVRERDEFLARELGDLAKSAESLKLLLTDLEEKLDREFASGIEKINTEFGAFFSLLFEGGRASLALSTSAPAEGEAPETGIEIKVDLPRKKIRTLEMLSGGERALTSIALLFAMSRVNPPPFLVLDETDAALDESNSKRYGDMLENLSRATQLIVITHNRETMSHAGVLYGVTMSGDGVSKLLSIKFDEAKELAR